MIPRIGLHTSIAGSLENAALQARDAGANCFQIFSSSPRQWRGSVFSAPEIARLRLVREKHDLKPLVIHDNYLINLASADEGIRAKSIEAFRGEIQRAVAIGAEYLVAHPGSYKNQSLEQAMVHFIRSLAAASSGLETAGLTLLLENTAGAGQALGSRLEELAVLREYAAPHTDLAISFCLDTCHLYAAGYDVSSEAGLRNTLAEAERLLGLENVPVFHANDSKGALGSHLDRHEHIGEGHIGEEGFRRILTHAQLRTKAFILETPMEEEDDGRRNVQTLQRLAVARRTSEPRRRSRC
jgi:deoxyribonuclease-4